MDSNLQKEDGSFSSVNKMFFRFLKGQYRKRTTSTSPVNTSSQNNTSNNITSISPIYENDTISLSFKNETSAIQNTTVLPFLNNATGKAPEGLNWFWTFLGLLFVLVVLTTLAIFAVRVCKHYSKTKESDNEENTEEGVQMNLMSHLFEDVKFYV